MTEDKKKEKVLHARISQDLEKQIRKEAGSLGVSVSNLVRNILANTFDLVEDIVSDSAAMTRSKRDRPLGPVTEDSGRRDYPPPGGPDQGRVLGWQEVVLNLNAVCAQCNGILKKGERAAIAVVQGGGPSPIICLTCLEEITHEDQDTVDPHQ